LVLQNSSQKRVLRFLKIAWFLIAGVFLLGQTAALAEPYLRECQDGVIYYYFPSRERSKPRATVIIAPAKRSVPAKVLARPVLRGGKALVKPEAAPARSASEVRPLMPGTTPDLHKVNPFNAKDNILAGTRYMLGLLAKLSYHYPLALPGGAQEPQLADRSMDRPSIQQARVVVPEGWKKILQAAQEPRFQLGQVSQGSNYLSEAGPLRYSFPVAGPFSFRDSWGDFRSGGRLHRAVDIVAPEGSEVYAITTGVIASLTTSAGGGITLSLMGQDGKGYGYMHLQGYAPGLVEGKVVRTGELIGYVGRTGIQTSAAHLHLQVYADHRLNRDELLNPYYFLVQLCHGVGVTDLNQPKIARMEIPETRTKQIQVYRRPGYADLRRRANQFSSKVLVIRND
jgi:murein DD-endopeptidase MepM/ murein hydrolase activator NlpD